MNIVLLLLFVGMGICSGSILYNHELSRFDKSFMSFIFVTQFVALFSLIFDVKEILFATHLIYVVTLLLGSLFATNIYIIFLIFAIITIAKICVIIIGDCPYHASSKKLKFFGGGENDDVLYAICLGSIIYRHW